MYEGPHVPFGLWEGELELSGGGVKAIYCNGDICNVIFLYCFILLPLFFFVPTVLEVVVANLKIQLVDFGGSSAD